MRKRYGLFQDQELFGYESFQEEHRRLEAGARIA